MSQMGARECTCVHVYTVNVYMCSALSVEAHTSVQLNVNKILRSDLSAADSLVPETFYRVYCFAEDDWPAEAIGVSVRSQSYVSHPSLPNKVSLDDVLNFSSASMFIMFARLRVCVETVISCIYHVISKSEIQEVNYFTLLPGDTFPFVPSTLDVSPPSFTLLEIQEHNSHNLQSLTALQLKGFSWFLHLFVRELQILQD